jgi:hypothetical protein
MYAAGRTSTEISDFLLFHYHAGSEGLLVNGDDSVYISEGRLFEGDASRYDRSVTRDINRTAQNVVVKSGIDYNRYVEVMWDLTLKYYFEGKVIIRAPMISRGSGDPWTSGINSLVMACLMILVHKFKVDPQSLGFDMKMRECKLEDVEFCSMVLWPSTIGLVFGPKPGKVLPKFGVSEKKLRAEHRLSYKIGSARSLYASCSHVPFLRKIVIPGPATTDPYEDWKVIGAGVTSSRETQLWAACRYGKTVAEIQEMELELEKAPVLTNTVRLDVRWAGICDLDNA